MEDPKQQAMWTADPTGTSFPNPIIGPNYPKGLQPQHPYHLQWSFPVGSTSFLWLLYGCGNPARHGPIAQLVRAADS